MPGTEQEVCVSTIVSVVVGVVLVAATIVGVAKSVSDHGHHTAPGGGAPTASVSLYGSRS
jgi:hypothetical protein